jgi:hypothetical protein
MRLIRAYGREPFGHRSRSTFRIGQLRKRREYHLEFAGPRHGARAQACIDDFRINNEMHPNRFFWITQAAQ